MKALLTAICACSMGVLSAHSAGAQVHFFPKDAIFDRAGQAVSTTGATALTPSPAPAQQTEIEKQLTILSGWTYYDAYQEYMIWLPAKINLYLLARPDFSKQNSAQNPNLFVVTPYALSAVTKGNIRGHLENNLATPTNALTTQTGKDPNDYNSQFQLFFHLPCLNADVPEPVFESAAGAFMNGFVTRLVLAKFEARMNRRIPNLPQPTPTFPASAPTSAFEGNIWANNVPFGTVVLNVLSKGNFALLGDATMCGWYAAQLLASSEKKYMDAALALLAMRYKTTDVGRMAGYTLNYLSGYAANFALASHPPSSDPTKILQDLGAVTQKGAHDPSNAPYAKINESLYRGIVAGFNVLANKPPSGDKPQQTKYYVDLLDGFNHGSIQAANVVYAQTFSIAWGIGYADGFRDGYSAGYSDGYRAGYNAGWGAAQNSFFDSLGGFLSNLGDDIGTIGTIVSVLGDLFL